MDQRCQDISIFGVEECRRKCNGHGVSRRMGVLQDLLQVYCNVISHFRSYLCMFVCRCVTVIVAVTVNWAGLLLTADTLEPEAAWTAAPLERPEVQCSRPQTRVMQHHLFIMICLCFLIVVYRF